MLQSALLHNPSPLHSAFSKLRVQADVKSRCIRMLTAFWEKNRQRKRVSSLSWALTWTEQQTQRRSASHLAPLLRFHTPAPSWLPFEVGLSAFPEVKVLGRGGNQEEVEGDEGMKSVSLVFALLLYFPLVCFAPIFHSKNISPCTHYRVRRGK